MGRIMEMGGSVSGSNIPEVPLEYSSGTANTKGRKTGQDKLKLVAHFTIMIRTRNFT
jgi:hypothetical protein